MFLMVPGHTKNKERGFHKYFDETFFFLELFTKNVGYVHMQLFKDILSFISFKFTK